MAEALGLTMGEKREKGEAGVGTYCLVYGCAASGGHGNLQGVKCPVLFVLPILCKFRVCQLYFGIIQRKRLKEKWILFDQNGVMETTLSVLLGRLCRSLATASKNLTHTCHPFS